VRRQELLTIRCLRSEAPTITRPVHQLGAVRGTAGAKACICSRRLRVDLQVFYHIGAAHVRDVVVTDGYR